MRRNNILGTQPVQEEKPSFRLTGRTVGHISADETKELDEATKSIMKSAWVSGKMKNGMNRDTERPSNSINFDAILETQREEKKRHQQLRASQRVGGWASIQRRMQQEPPPRIDESLDFNPAEKFGGGGAAPGRKRWGNFEPREQPRQPFQQQNPLPSRHQVVEGIGFKGAAIATKSMVGSLPKGNIESVKKAAQEAAAEETDELSDSSSSSIDEIEAEKLGLNKEVSDSEEDEDEVKPLFSKRFGYILPDGTTVKTKEMEQEEEKQKEQSIGRKSKYANPVSLIKTEDDHEVAGSTEVVRRRTGKDNKPKAVVGEAAKIVEEEQKKKAEEEEAKLRKLDEYKKQVEMERLRKKKEKEDARKRENKKASKTTGQKTSTEWNSLDSDGHMQQQQQPKVENPAPQQQQHFQEPTPDKIYQQQPVQQQYNMPPQPVQQQYPGQQQPVQQQPFQQQYPGQPQQFQQQYPGQPQPVQQIYQAPAPAPQQATGLSRWLKNNKTSAELEAPQAQQVQPVKPVQQQPVAQPQQIIIQPQISQNGQAIPPIMITAQTLIQLLAAGVQPPSFSNVDPDDLDETVAKREMPQKVNRADIRRRAIRTLEAQPTLAQQDQMFKEQETFYEEEVVYEEEEVEEEEEEE